MTHPVALPPSFDAATYLARNPDLPRLSDPAAEAHYRREGRADGRVASPLAEREGFLAYLSDAARVLEIGPFCSPLLSGPQVEYLDVLDAMQLRTRAETIGLDPARCPDLIHYVGQLSQVDKQFDAVVSSHAIEHQPDLVRHLREIERVLTPDGVFCLIIPDKRFCFDHYLPESTIAKVLQAWTNGRRTHGLESIVEHMALTTHNDAERHWAGDHGDPARGRAERLRAALERYEQHPGAYIDVHAWQFTPDSFRTLIDELGELGLIGLEIGGVYDTPHGRHEFCAMLRLSATARAAKRAAAADISVIALQTADPHYYAPMLAITQRNVSAFCRRHGFEYQAFVGIIRGFHAWQASYNRIPMMKALLDAGYRGWVLYVDADAYIADRDFDLVSYLHTNRDRGAILTASGVTDARWDVNNGVMLINFAHYQGRRLIEALSAKFAGIDDDRLRAAEMWLGEDNDQDLLHQILRDDAAIADAIRVESRDLINSAHARFIRQHLRAQTADLAERTRKIAQEIDALDSDDQGLPPTKTASDLPVAMSRLSSFEPRLAEAPAGVPLPSSLIEEIVRGWRGRAAGQPVADFLRDFHAALEKGDVAALTVMLAGAGRAAFTQGVLGGARQHKRANDLLFARRLARSGYDRLVALAEAVGALDVENPESGPWGVNAARAPADLFGAVERALSANLSPPSSIGNYLGLDLGGGKVLHPRMLDAIHAAWRLRVLASPNGLTGVVEVGGGAGLTAYYARRLGADPYHIVGVPIMAAFQAAVLEDVSAVVESWPDRPADILFNQDSLPEMPVEGGIALLRSARERGARLFLSINSDGRVAVGGRTQTPVRDLVAAAGGWRAAGRHRHWLRAGHVEEIWLAE